MDDVDIKEAEDRWRDADIPCPSLVVRSGSGIHGYWLLQRALQTPQERSRFLAMVPQFYKSFGGDHVQNLSRASAAWNAELQGRSKRPLAVAVHTPRV